MFTALGDVRVAAERNGEETENERSLARVPAGNTRKFRFAHFRYLASSGFFCAVLNPAFPLLG